MLFTNDKVREVYSLVGPCGSAPRSLFHGTRPGPAEGGRPIPPTSSGTGVTRFVSRYILELQQHGTAAAQGENALPTVLIILKSLEVRRSYKKAKENHNSITFNLSI